MVDNVEQEIQKYKNLVAANPSDQESRMLLGMAYGAHGQYDEAIKELREAVALKPERAMAHFDLALAYHLKAMLDDAIKEYKEAIRLDPGHTDAQLNLANAYLEMGDPDDALSIFKDFITKDPDSSAAYVSFGIALVLMVVVPNLLAEGVGRLANSISDAPAASNPFAEEKRPLLYNLVSGGFRAVILFGYIGFISRIREIRRVFQYHGAEHKAVFAFETGGPLTTERAQTFSTHHPRCGTSFLVVVVAVSIVVFAFVAWAYVAAWPGFASLPFVVKKVLILLGHIVALPVVAGVSYEFLKLSARWSERGGVWRWLVWPGLQTQRLTTRPPDDRQVEVALLALKAALAIQPGATERQVELIPPASAPTQAPLVESAPTGV